MKIIDIARKGNVVRFYLGKKTKDWGWTNKHYKDSSGKTPEWLKPSESYYGDDWDDAPFEHNAGSVYPRFVRKVKDVAYPFDSIVIEPNEGGLNSPYCMYDLVAGEAPRLLIISRKAQEALFDGGRGHSPWYYAGSYCAAVEAIAGWESEHGRKLRGVTAIYMGDKI